MAQSSSLTRVPSTCWLMYSPSNWRSWRLGTHDTIKEYTDDEQGTGWYGVDVLTFVYVEDRDAAPDLGLREILLVQLTSSRVRLGQSFKTVGYGSASCWGDLGAGSVEADVFYIPFIVSVQYIGY